RTEKIEHQIDARPLLRDVVLEIGKQFFVPQVDLRRQSNQEGVDVEPSKRESPSQLNESELYAEANACLLALRDFVSDAAESLRDLGSLRNGGPTRQTGRPGEQAIQLLFGDVKTLERVVV